MAGIGTGCAWLGLPSPAARCPTPVRRHSHFKGRSEGRIWRPTTRKDVQAILKAAEIYNEAGLHQKGERSGPLGSVALDVLRLFVNLIDFRTGRRAGNYNDHGPLGPLTRYDRAGAEEPAGAWFHRLAAALRADRERGARPQVQQASNAYRLSLPEKARQFLAGSARPPPADHGQDQQAWSEAIDAYRKALPSMSGRSLTPATAR